MAHKKDKNFKEKKFRLNTSSLFLTYKQTENNSLNKELIFSSLKSKLNKEERKVIDIVVSFEMSDTNHPYSHFHVLAKLNKPINIKNPRLLDIQEVHGQYEKTRSYKRALAYVVKGRDFIYEGVNPDKEISKNIKDPFKRFIHTCIYQSKTYDEASGLIKPHSTSLDIDIYSDFLKHPKRYDRFLASFYYTYKSPQLYIEIKGSLFQEILSTVQNKEKSLFIYGPTGIGKTSLFLVTFQDRILFIRHKDALKKLEKDKHLAVLFDDMNFKNFSKEDFINLVDQRQPSHIDVKRSMITVPSSVSKLFTSNKNPLDWLGINPSNPSEQDKAILRRMHLIKLTNKDIKVHTKPVPITSISDKNILITWKTLRYLIEKGKLPE